MGSVPQGIGSTPQEPTTEPNDVSDAIQATMDEGSDNSAPETEPSIDQLGLTEEQLAAINKIKQKQIDEVNNHWKSTTSKHQEELTRLRKLENTLYELEQKDKELQQAEQENEFDTDKRIKIGSERLNVQSKKENIEAEIRIAQTLQKVPDFEELVNSGYIKNEIVTIAKANGHANPSEEEIAGAIKNLRANPAQAIFVANAARKEKQINELSNKNKQIIENTNKIGEKITVASEQKIVTNTRTGKPKYTQADIWSMKPEERQALIEAGRKNGSFKK